jgi:hypothetical protein
MRPGARAAAVDQARTRPARGAGVSRVGSFVRTDRASPPRECKILLRSHRLIITFFSYVSFFSVDRLLLSIYFSFVCSSNKPKIVPNYRSWTRAFFFLLFRFRFGFHKRTKQHGSPSSSCKQTWSYSMRLGAVDEQLALPHATTSCRTAVVLGRRHKPLRTAGDRPPRRLIRSTTSALVRSL